MSEFDGIRGTFSGYNFDERDEHSFFGVWKSCAKASFAWSFTFFIEINVFFNYSNIMHLLNKKSINHLFQLLT